MDKRQPRLVVATLVNSTACCLPAEISIWPLEPEHPWEGFTGLAHAGLVPQKDTGRKCCLREHHWPSWLQKRPTWGKCLPFLPGEIQYWTLSFMTWNFFLFICIPVDQVYSLLTQLSEKIRRKTDAQTDGNKSRTFPDTEIRWQVLSEKPSTLLPRGTQKTLCGWTESDKDLFTLKSFQEINNMQD